MRVAVIGGGIAGDTAAATARACDPAADVVLVTEESHPLYSPCIFGHFLSGDIRPEHLFLRTEHDYRGMGIERLTGARVRGVDAARQVISLERSELAYDRLVLATGSEPIIPKFEGGSKRGVVALKTITDLEHLTSLVTHTRPARIAIVGSGPVGCELAIHLRRRGHGVCLIERVDRVMPRLLDADLAAVVQSQLEAKGIQVFVGEEVRELGGGACVELIRTEKREVPCDIVCLAVGMRPRTELARQVGIAIGKVGGVVVDSSMETSVTGIYACGDCVESHDVVLGEPRLSMLWHSASWQGYVAGSNSVGMRRTYPGSLSWAIVDTLPGWVVSSGHVKEDYKESEVEIRDRRTSDCWMRTFMVEDTVAGLQLVSASAPRKVGLLLAAIRSRTRLSQASRFQGQSGADAATWRVQGELGMAIPMNPVRPPRRRNGAEPNGELGR